MPHKSCNVVINDEDQNVNFRYECWKDVNTGEGIIAVEGNSDSDHLFLVNNRVDVMNALKEQESLSSMRYLESQGNGNHTEISMETYDNGLIASGKFIGSGLSNRELSKQGQNLIDQEYDNNINLSKQEIDRTKNPPGIDI